MKKILTIENKNDIFPMKWSRFCFLSLFLPFPLLAVHLFSPLKRHEKIKEVPTIAEKPKSAYTPWWVGPILAGMGECAPPKTWIIQPFLSFGRADKFFLTHGKTLKIHHREMIDWTTQIEVGLVRGFDITVFLDQYNAYIRHREAHVFGDTVVALGMQFCEETNLVPATRILIREKFPTGKFERLDPLMELWDGFVGGGCFETSFGLNASKRVYWFFHHPMCFHLNLSIAFPSSSARVHGFNSYGGGFGTNGTISPPKFFYGIFSFEFSFTQRWVFAMDTIYNRWTRYRFSGTPGVNFSGKPAINSLRYQQALSFTPSLEYNISRSQGFLGGVLITAYGRNVTKLLSTVISYEIVF